MIPDLEDNVLPEGVHDCTVDEADAVFGRFQRTDRRITLTERLKAYLAEAKRSGIVVAVIIDGSYTTAKDDPDDIDLIVVVRADVDTTSLRPFEYNAIATRMIRATYRFDVKPVADGSEDLAGWTEFFSRINPAKHAGLTSRTRKGMLRVLL